MNQSRTDQSHNEQLEKLAESAVAMAKKAGANEVAAGTSVSREVEVQWRDGALEKVSEATSRSLGLQLYVDGRYASVATSDLREDALRRFIGEAVELTRMLAPDPFRRLPDPKLYEGAEKVDLMLDDPDYGSVTAIERVKAAETLEQAARSVGGDIISVTTGYSDSQTQSHRVHSNGFSHGRRQTSSWVSASTTMKDIDGRRPEESSYAGARLRRDLPALERIGTDATSRALSRLGSKKIESRVWPMAVDNRVAGRLIGSLLGPASASSIQQKRSMFEDKLGQKIGHERLTLTDDPLVAKGFGSRFYDGEGLAAHRLPMIEAGVLKNIYVDWYYGQKLKMAPTTGSMSNLIVKLGTQSQVELLKQMGEGIFVTGFLGGNSNGTTGDFSFGVQGFRVRAGQIAEPVAEMNISGNHLKLWNTLAAVGNDPYPYSTMAAPTLLFNDVQFAGS